MSKNRRLQIVGAVAGVVLLGGAAWPGPVPAIVFGPMGYMISGAFLSFVITAFALHQAHRRIQEKTDAGFRALLESFQHLADGNRTGLIYWSKEGVLTDANETFLKMVGRDRDEIKKGALRLTDLSPAEQVERDFRARAELDVNGVAAPYEKEFLHKDGHRIPVLQGMALLEDARH
ncbi:MAG: PAS domain S-box protein, partial [Gemmataceae bacterium]